MKSLKYLIVITLSVIFSSCDNDDFKDTNLKPSATGVMTDIDGNEYGWVRLGSLDWMTSNLRSGTAFFDLEDDYWGGKLLSLQYSIEQTRREYELYGNLYTFEQAVEQIPDGWRLPTDDDWKELERLNGMSTKELDKREWRNGVGFAIMEDMSREGCGINLRLGGCIQKWGYGSSVKQYHIGDYGYYWSGTPDYDFIDDAVFYRKITPSQNKVYRQSSTLEKYMSVRYVRDAK